MSATTQPASGPASLLGAFNAVRNWRAGLLLFGSIVAMALLFGVFSFFALKLAGSDLPRLGRAVGILGLTLGTIVVLLGFSATGILLMDQSKGLPRRSTGSALFASLVTLPRMLGLLLLELLLVFSLLLVAALLLLLCKVPVLGPALFTIVFPVCVLAIGCTWFALGFVVNPLAYPALWEGSTIRQAVLKLWFVVRHDALAVVTHLLILWAMVMLSVFVLYGVVALGTLATGAVSTAILDFNPGSPETVQYLLGSLIAGDVSLNGYGTAALIATILLAGLVVVLPTLIYTQGVCLVYLQRARNIDTSEAEARLEQRMQGLRQQAAAAQEQLRRSGAVAPAHVPVPPRHCPGCGCAVVVNAAFCESCGSHL